MFCGTLSLAYTSIVAAVLPYAERSANDADVLTSLLLAMQSLLTAGFQDEDDAESHSAVISAIFAGDAAIALAQMLAMQSLPWHSSCSVEPNLGIPR